MTAPILGSVVDVNELLQTVAAAFIAGVGVTFVFSLAVLGGAKFADASRDGRPVAAAVFASLAAVAVLATAAGIAVGVIVMTSG